MCITFLYNTRPCSKICHFYQKTNGHFHIWGNYNQLKREQRENFFFFFQTFQLFIFFKFCAWDRHRNLNSSCCLHNRKKQDQQLWLRWIPCLQLFQESRGKNKHRAVVTLWEWNQRRRFHIFHLPFSLWSSQFGVLVFWFIKSSLIYHFCSLLLLVIAKANPRHLSSSLIANLWIGSVGVFAS